MTRSSSATTASARSTERRANDAEDTLTTYSDSQLIYHESYYPEPVPLQRPCTQKNNFNGKSLRCTVVQITNLASNQEYEYTLDVHFNARKITTISGRLQKLTPKASGTSPDDGAATFPIHSPFELTFEFSGRPVQQRLTRSLSFWKRKEQQGANADAQKPTVYARLRLLSGDCVDAFGIDHMQRYTFTQPLEQELPLNLEMLVKYDYVDVPRETTSLSCATKVIPGKTASIATALQACAAGDYLTILERGKGFPYWRRYWARMEGDTISLYDFTYHDQKDARGYLPLSTLKAVSQPSDEDLENVCYSRSTGLTIRLQEKSAALLSPVRLEPDEAVHGKVHLFADTPRAAEYWRLTLALYEDYQSETTEDNIDLRYVW
ncbi:hypothetical protein BCR43DRAFT_37553 [Syncephalastrum racemosum]|uniref:PH domain-containing protein n=1 Tax=Syncephalastrum racemosum TaxID=13706 RepID=A0A1X2HU70_SYNRA|nr:hypothetical protein BCR43DRAFT_37553 [Syncephalastrum racemosum]